MRMITSTADRLLSIVVPKTTAGACTCKYSTGGYCACRSGKKWYYEIGNCNGCSGSCGCHAPACIIETSQKC
jgi:hypothetical protein